MLTITFLLDIQNLNLGFNMFFRISLAFIFNIIF